MGRGALSLLFRDCQGSLNVGSSPSCCSKPKVNCSIGLGELQEGSGDDESFRGSKLFITDTDLLRELSEFALFIFLPFPFGEEDVEYMVDVRWTVKIRAVALYDCRRYGKWMQKAPGMSCRAPLRRSSGRGRSDEP